MRMRRRRQIWLIWHCSPRTTIDQKSQTEKQILLRINFIQFRTDAKCPSQETSIPKKIFFFCSKKANTVSCLNKNQRSNQWQPISEFQHWFDKLLTFFYDNKYQTSRWEICCRYWKRLKERRCYRNGTNNIIRFVKGVAKNTCGETSCTCSRQD